MGCGESKTALKDAMVVRIRCRRAMVITFAATGIRSLCVAGLCAAATTPAC